MRKLFIFLLSFLAILTFLKTANAYTFKVANRPKKTIELNVRWINGTTEINNMHPYPAMLIVTKTGKIAMLKGGGKSTIMGQLNPDTLRVKITYIDASGVVFFGGKTYQIHVVSSAAGVPIITFERQRNLTNDDKTLVNHINQIYVK